MRNIDYSYYDGPEQYHPKSDKVFPKNKYQINTSNKKH